MKLGSFYGFTVPMLLTAYDQDIVHVLETFNTKLNSISAEDISKELWHFRKAIQSIKVDVSLFEDKLLQYNTSARVNSGKIVGAAIDDEVKEDIMNSLCDHCAKKLYENLKLGKQNYDISSLEARDTFNKNLYSLVEKAMTDKTFDLSNVAILQREFLKLLKSDTILGDKIAVMKNIKYYCSIKESIPSTIYTEQDTISLSEDEKSVIEYYINNLDKLDKLMDAIKVTGINEDTVFGVSFIDFLNRKPTCLYYMIVKQFDHLKRSDIRLFPNILANVKKEFTHCEELIREHLLQKDKVLEYVTADNVEEVFEDEDSSVIHFLKEVFYLGFSEIAYDDLVKLKTLYNSAQYLTLENLNSIWGTKFTFDSFIQLVNKMNKLYIGGLNLYTVDLFKQSLGDILFVDGGHINKPQEYLEELDQICFNINALISTFKEIGGDLSV